MTTKTSANGKPRTKPAKSKGGRSAGKSPAKSKATKAKSAKTKVDGTGKGAGAGTSTSGGRVSPTKRLRPGELDGLVIAHMREHGEALPLAPGAIAKGIGRSSGAVGNCLERLAKADSSPVRRTSDKPRAYDLGTGVEARGGLTVISEPREDDPGEVGFEGGADDDGLPFSRPTSSGGEVPVQLGANIVEIRRAAHLRVDELSERAAIKRSALENNEDGGSAPNVLAALKIASSLDVSIDRLTLGVFWNPPAAMRGAPRATKRLAGYFSTRPAHLGVLDGEESSVHEIKDQAEAPAIIGANLRDARRRRGLMQGGMGLEQTHVSRIELGVVEPALDTLIGLARRLELPVEAMLAGMSWEALGPSDSWQAATGGARERDSRSLDAAVARGLREGRGNPEIAADLGVKSAVVRRIAARLRKEGRTLDADEGAWTGIDVEDELRLRRMESCLVSDPVEADEAKLIVAANIRTNRKRLGLGQEAVAKAAGLASTALSRLERGGVFSFPLLIRVAAALGVRCSALTAGVRWDHAAGTFLVSRRPPAERPGAAELVGQNARRIRRAAGLTEATVARRAGKKGRFFNALELGGKLPKPVSLLMLARALEVPVADLLAGICDWYVRPLPPPAVPADQEASEKAAQQERLLRLWRRGDDLASISEAVDLKPKTVFGVVDRLRDIGVDIDYRVAPTGPAQLSARLRRRRGNRPPVVRAEAGS